MRPFLAIAAFLAINLACAGGEPETVALPSVTAEALPEPQPAIARAPVPSAPQTAWVVIVAGSADEGEGRGHFDEAVRNGLASVGDHPRLAHSDDIEGLKPGFWITVAATVDDKDTAAAMAKALGTTWEGAYIREVKVSEPESVRCPADPRCTSAVQPEWRAIILFDVTDGMESEDWGFFTDDVMTISQASGVEARWFDDTKTVITRDGKPVGEVDVEPFLDEMFGYVFAQEGKPPEFHAHAPPDMVVSAASLYFGVTVERPR